MPATLGSAPDIARAILHTKGVVLDSLLEDRLAAEASKEAKQREVIDQLRAAKQRYTQLLMELPKDFSAEAQQRREAELEKRSARVEELEATLARQVIGLGRARRALRITLARVQGALAGDQVLVELLRYNHYLGKNEWERRYGPWRSPPMVSQDGFRLGPLLGSTSASSFTRSPFEATRTKQRCSL